jgi:hypothetical protein
MRQVAVIILGVLLCSFAGLMLLKYVQVVRELQIAEPSLTDTERHLRAAPEAVQRRLDDPSLLNIASVIIAGGALMWIARRRRLVVRAARRTGYGWVWPATAVVIGAAYLLAVYTNKGTFWYGRHPGADATIVAIQFVEGLNVMLPIVLGPAFLLWLIRAADALREQLDEARARVAAARSTAEQEKRRLQDVPKLAGWLYTIAIAPVSGMLMLKLLWVAVELATNQKPNWLGPVVSQLLSLAFLGVMVSPFLGFAFVLQRWLGRDLRFETAPLSRNLWPVLSAPLSWLGAMGFYVKAEWQERALEDDAAAAGPAPDVEGAMV